MLVARHAREAQVRVEQGLVVRRLLGAGWGGVAGMVRVRVRVRVQYRCGAGAGAVRVRVWGRVRVRVRVRRRGRGRVRGRYAAPCSRPSRARHGRR